MIASFQDCFTRCVERRPGATRATLDATAAALSAPLTRVEVSDIVRLERNPFPPPDPQHNLWRPFDPAQWRLPRGLPAMLRAFLGWSDGGVFTTGKRHFQLLGTFELRKVLLAHHFPRYMPDALPFARTAGGYFYVFDLRRPAPEGAEPVVFCAAGKLGFEASVGLGSFNDALRGSTDPEEQLR